MTNFLTATWTNLLVATYEVEKKMLLSYLPYGTELNHWNGKYLISVVGFMFTDPFIMGIKMPFFNRFPEINLRFYVKRKVENEWKPGVVFIKEICPSHLICTTAKLLYSESFIRATMRYEEHYAGNERCIRYSWRRKSRWNYLELSSSPEPVTVDDEAVEAFICNQYAAFNKINDRKTLSFEISHRPWRIYPTIHFDKVMDADIFRVKGLSDALHEEPVTTFRMDGSLTQVSRPTSL